MRLVCIDPGNCSGVAVFDGSTLIFADAVNIDDGGPTLGFLRQCGANDLVIEVPTVYQHSKADPQDIVKLAFNAGQWAATIHKWPDCKVEKPHPIQWKGNVPKDIHNARVLSRLRTEETAILPRLSKTKSHNMIDAIGLGLWRLRRM